MRKGYHLRGILLLIAGLWGLASVLHAQCQFPVFAQPATVQTASAPYSVNTADLNMDGDLDLVVANYNSSNVYIMLGNGDGTFTSPAAFDVGNGPVMAIATGDYNSDNVLDIATANWYANTFSVLLGIGNGSFAAATHYPVGGNPRSIASGDFNADGKTDLAVACEGPDYVAVVLRSGETGFASPVNVSTGSNPNSVVAKDCSGDGKLDLIVSNGDGPSIAVHFGNGNGTFATPTTYTVSPKPYSIITGDFNGDDVLDIAAAISVSDKAAVLLGNGGGSFGSPSYYSVGDFPYYIHSADVNRDGALDIITANGDSDNISILQGAGNGTFGTATNISVGNDPRGIVAGEFNSQGGIDLAVSNFGGNTLTLLMNSCLLSPVPDVTQLPVLFGQCSVTVSGIPTATDDFGNTVYGSTTDPLTYESQGTFTITWKYDDGLTPPTYQTQQIVVEDITDPTISVSVTPAYLWPCNHKMETVTATVNASDNCTGVTYVLLSITSSEADAGIDHKDEPFDIQNVSYGTADLSFDLRRERDKEGDGRSYTITYQATDVGENTVIATEVVMAPLKNMQKSAYAYPAFTQLQPNYPNPFNPTTVIPFTVSGERHLHITVSDVYGREVAVLADGRHQPGSYTVEFDGGSFPSGVYYCRLSDETGVQTIRMLLSK